MYPHRDQALDVEYANHGENSMISSRTIALQVRDDSLRTASLDSEVDMQLPLPTSVSLTSSKQYLQIDYNKLSTYRGVNSKIKSNMSPHQPATVIVEHSSRAGLRYIHLKSMVLFVNKTSLLIRIAVSETAAASSNTIPKLSSGQAKGFLWEAILPPNTGIYIILYYVNE